ncbi:CmpA/NrtA family ABC transporter substrate-binding protein [Usitatibacter palustris]|uniref:Nitrate/nitrite binding protein NrtA n=1 Tax=Usitatibacter palustris TaxID=2732487 RepID=A0A6M4H3L3_9PROT|nr:CmpA/NrtA family ABC transporter substrate-binding protein [Usitatibacter palustris]QJR13872.1 Nitrate/nitrite binding protein NrtA [Usitatibacter palustris]
MSLFDNPYDSESRLSCACGRHASKAAHEADAEVLSNQALETAVLKALFPRDGERRKFLRAVGANAAMGAIASLFPLGALQAMAQEKGKLEKKDVKIGFIPITCATPLIMSLPLGFYEKQGLNVSLVKTAGWALIRDKVQNKEYDASHLLAPMPLAMSMGAGSNAVPMNVATIQNSNGQAITLALKHKDKRDPKQWKGFKFAVPFEYSMHNFLLRYYVAEAGLDPDKDIQIRVVPPPEMVANLRADNLDGYLGPDPFNQRAVYDNIGFIHILTKEIWDGHPCCSFGVRTEWVKENPNTFAAMYRAVLNAAAMAAGPENRATIANAIAPANYLNQPVPVLEQVLTGKYADGLGGVKNVPNRIEFDPVPWNALGVWILTQMKRWGYIKGDVNYKSIVEQVYLMTDAKKRMKEEGIAAPADMPKKIIVMGKVFDASKPDAYVASFAIKKA